MGVSMEVVSKSILKEISNLEPINILCQDVFNICSALSKIKVDRETSEKEEQLAEQIKKGIATFKFDAEATLGQMAAKNKLLEDQIKDLTKRLEESPQASSPPPALSKTSKKKTTRKK